MEEKKFSILKPAKFTPKCPNCKTPMSLIRIKGLKTGAWRCRKCSAEFWDKVERSGKISKEDLKKYEVVPGPERETINCLRCVTIPMVKLYDDSQYCPQCSSRFYSEGAPPVEKIIDQKIKCGTKTLMYNRDNMSAKHKNRGKSKSGRNRRKKPTFQRNYYIPDGNGNKGA